MGGSVFEEFLVESLFGEDVFVWCFELGYVVNVEVVVIVCLDILFIDGLFEVVVYDIGDILIIVSLVVWVNEVDFGCMVIVVDILKNVLIKV